MNASRTYFAFLLATLIAATAGCHAPTRSTAPETAAQTQQPKDGSQTEKASSQNHASFAGIPNRPEQIKFPPLHYEPPRASDYRVVLKTGPVAYVAEDRELPLINIAVLVRTGQYVEPADKAGLASITGYLLARGGTQSKTAEELEERLAFLAAQLNSGVGDSQGSVSLNLLSKDIDEGLAILREVLTAPRFQQDKLDLTKVQTLQRMRERNDDSSSIEGREAAFLAFGEDFWANRQSTQSSIESISHDDIVAFHRKWFYPSNFVVAVSGDFSRADMVERLETFFADWPFAGATPPPIPTNTAFAEPNIYIVDKDVPQGRVTMLLPGIKRDNPDYFPVMIMNDILGGGGFTSRIVNRVRSDEGLAYSAGSSFNGGVYYPLTFRAGFQTKSRTVPYAISIVLQEMQKMLSEPVTSEELDTTKRSFIDTFPRTFATKAQTVGVFAQEEFTGRYFTDPAFYSEYRSRVEAVSKERVLEVARKYLASDKMAVLVVGKREDILLGHPDHAVKLSDLSKGKIREVPLRDPMTMLPVK